MKLELKGYEDQKESSFTKTPNESGWVVTLEEADMPRYVKITIGGQTVVVKAPDLSKATLVF